MCSSDLLCVWMGFDVGHFFYKATMKRKASNVVLKESSSNVNNKMRVCNTSITQFFKSSCTSEQSASPFVVEWRQIEFVPRDESYTTSPKGTLWWGRFEEAACTLSSPPPWRAVKAFDMDSTLIRTKSSKVHPIDAEDWIPWHPTLVSEKLRAAASEQSCRVIIISNQRGVTNQNIPIQEIQQRFEAAIRLFRIPCDAFLAIDDDVFRKPRIGIWKFFVQECNQGISPDLSSSFYVGDAAGRASIRGQRKRDFSDTDYKFSLNVGLPFFTPEQFFLEQVELVPRSFPFDPRSLKPRVFDELSKLVPSDTQQVFILVGPPGSGKTHFCRHYASQYISVSKDLLTLEARLQKATSVIEEGNSLVIDMQNRNIKNRKSYLDLIAALGAQGKNIPAVAIVFDYPKELCLHLMKFGHLVEHLEPAPVRDLHSFYKFYQPPTTEEGFLRIVRLTVDRFVPGPFDNAANEQLFYSFLT